MKRNLADWLELVGAALLATAPPAMLYMVWVDSVVGLKLLMTAMVCAAALYFASAWVT